MENIMKQSKWMWCPGDFELYHGMLVHNRRTQGGVFPPSDGEPVSGQHGTAALGPVYYPPMWRVDSPRRTLFLYKVAILEKPETVTFYANTEHASILADGVRYPAGVTVTLKPGRQMVKIFAYKDGGLPAVIALGIPLLLMKHGSTALLDSEIFLPEPMICIRSFLTIRKFSSSPMSAFIRFLLKRCRAACFLILAVSDSES